jgi:hypothetical protein
VTGGGRTRVEANVRYRPVADIRSLLGAINKHLFVNEGAHLPKPRLALSRCAANEIKQLIKKSGGVLVSRLWTLF